MNETIMDTTREPTDELIRELYACFGLAYYHSEVLHRGLCMILAVYSFPQPDLLTRPRIEESLARAFSLTLGEVIHELADKIPPDYSIQLEQALIARNFLAHHFWFDRSHLMFDYEHVSNLIAELDEYSHKFSCLDEEMSKWFHPLQLNLGMTDERLQECMTKILAGVAEDPLPSKEVVKEIDKKLKRVQRLIRVWEFTLPSGGKPLIFETQDGSLWQLCDVGFGLTGFDKISPDWVVHSAIEPYLPADIIPRPKDAKPWEYEFKLRHGAVLWVKPGKRPSSFKWGIRTKKPDTEQNH